MQLIEQGLNVFAGGIARRDTGEVLMVSMRHDPVSTFAQIVGRTAPSLLGPYSEPMVLAEQAFDAGVAVVDGYVVVVYTADGKPRGAPGGIYGRVGLGLDSLGPELPVALGFSGAFIHEVTLKVVSGVAQMAYAVEPRPNQTIQNIQIRTLGVAAPSALQPGASVQVATDSGGGPGGAGNVRATICRVVGGMALAYHRAVGVTIPRVICWATRTTGLSWSPGRVIATEEGIDLYNPFAFRNSDSEYAVYFTRYDGSHRSLASVTSTDGGQSWSKPATIPSVGSARAVVAKENSVRYVFASDQDATELALWPLP